MRAFDIIKDEVRPYLTTELVDDEMMEDDIEKEGISFFGETLEDFLKDIEVGTGTLVGLELVNVMLQNNGIEEINYK